MPKPQHAEPPDGHAPTPEDFIALAAELVGTVHDYGPDVIAGVLDPLSVGHLYRLTVTLAAMVDPERTPAELLAWLDEPVRSRTFEPTAIRPDSAQRACPDCGGAYRASHLARHRRSHTCAA